MTLRGTTKNAKSAKARGATPPVPSAPSRTDAGKVRLGELLTETITGEWGCESSPSNGVAVLRTTNFTNGGEINYDNLAWREVAQDKVDRKHLCVGDIVVEKSGGTKDHPVGRVVFFDRDDGVYLCNNFTQILRPDRSLIVPRFLFYTLRAKYEMRATESMYNKTTGIQNLKMSLYMAMSIPLPPLPAQRRIADELDQLCALKKNAEDRLAILDQIVKSRFVEMFGDVEEGSAKFQVVHLIDVCTSMSAGKDVPEDYVKVKDSLHQVPIYSNGVENDGLYGYASEPRIFEPSLTISGRGTIGYVCRREVPFVPIIRLIVATPNKDIVDLVFLQWALKDRCAKNTGTTIPQLPVPAAKSIKVILPPLALQREFAAFVTEVDKSKLTLRETVATLDQLYRAKLQEYFG